MSVPSVLLADASWYGSLRGGVEFGGDADGKFNTTGSRWGIQGSTEVSEGLTAVYKFETRVGSGGTASQGTNQLYAGLSGGFGSLTLGKFHNAAYNHTGAIRDIGYWYSSGDVNSKIGDTVSYAFSSDAASFQVDAIMDGGKDTGNAIDEVQFGVTVNMGDIGKIALSYVDVDNASMDEMMTGVPGFNAMLKADSNGMLDKSGLDVRDKTSGKPINGTIVSVAHTINKEAVVLRQVYASDELTANEMKSDGYKMAGGTLYAKSCLSDAGVPLTGKDECKEKTWAYVQTINTPADEGDVTTTHNIFVADSGNLANVINTPGSDAKPAVGDPMIPMPREVIVIRTTEGSGTVDVSDASHIVTTSTTAADSLGAHHGDKVFVYSLPAAGAGDDDPPKVIYATKSVSASGDDDAVPAMFFNDDGTALRDARTTTEGEYYQEDGVLKVSGGADEEDDAPVLATARVMDDMDNPDYDPGAPAGNPTMHTVAHTVTMNTKDMDYGYTQTGVSAQLNLGGLTLGLGYSETESNDPMDMMDATTTYLGASGGIGDTGMSWRAWARNKEDHKGMETGPWGIGLDKALGGGAFTFIEHVDADDGASGSTIVALGVNF